MAKDYFDFQITGDKELVKVLSKMDGAFSRSVTKSALRKVANPIAKRARDKAPRRTGRGAKSIKIYAMKPDHRDLAKIGIGPDRRYFYMMFYEFGTKLIKAVPFMRPAWDALIQPQFEQFGQIMWDVMHKKIKAFVRQAGKGKLSRMGARVLG